MSKRKTAAKVPVYTGALADATRATQPVAEVRLRKDGEMPRLSPSEHWAILQDIENMSDGEFFIYGSTYHERKVVQADELMKCFAYHEELFIADDETMDAQDKVLREIAAVLDRKVWSPADLDRIAVILRQNGYAVRDPENSVDEVESNVTAALQAVARGVRR